MIRSTSAKLFVSPRVMQKVYLVCCLALLLWAIEIINFSTGHRLNAYGIYPHSSSPLPGILLAPWLHGGAFHLFMNTLPFMVLSWFVMLRGIGVWLAITLFISVLSGLMVWFFGRDAYHIGASGLIFGYLGYLVFRGIFERNFSSVAIAGFVVMFYGGMFMGIIPASSKVSWESHLFGLLAGVLAAWVWKRPLLLKKTKKSHEPDLKEPV